MYKWWQRKDRTVIITGIGKETARELARRGGWIINVYARHLDLTSTKSIGEFTKKINEEEQRVDLLINNAGVMRCPHWQTEDGFEMQFGVNHLDHFLLTNLLLDMMKHSAPSHIINVSSLAHVVGEMDFNDLNWENKKYNTKVAYCQSKLANVLFTKELVRQLPGTGVTVNALHPGVVETEHTGMHQSPFSSAVLGEQTQFLTTSL
ncbi:retinol dehydrogenase 13-like [Acipenser oxyrinchus oxyrinchus]|uniref:Retinol dehydrogenase 13-like n=1 Tax=Acipenser oxyrinchus oxyrinchus TaxID=40147 RepID=A0AAD8GAR3_ACIOX|nr:retinol dehydrogenase 13-like [Acipenser oxyrinchus oxyrinchus]